MEKETVKAFNLEAAFKALDEIEIPQVAKNSKFKANRVNLRERFSAKAGHIALVEDYFDVSDTEELTAAQEEREAEIAKAKLARIEKIVDLEAETEEDILPSYVGKMIMQCPQCMTLFYKNEEDIEKAEDDPSIVNITEPCQHCGNMSGYNLIGKVGAVSEDELANFEAEEVAETDLDDDELDLDFTEEGTEEVDAEGTDEAGEAMEDDDEELDLDFDFKEEEEEESEEANESLHNSKFLNKIKDKNILKTEFESEHLTLNEAANAADNAFKKAFISKLAKDGKDAIAKTLNKFEFKKADTASVDKKAGIIYYTTEEETAKVITSALKPIAEDLADWYRKKFDKPASTTTQQAWEDELNGEMGKLTNRRKAHLEKKFAQQRDWEKRHPETLSEDAEVTDAEVDELLDTLWSEEQPTVRETEAALADINEKTEKLTAIDDLDEESFDKHLTEYLNKVYSNVCAFRSTNCTLRSNKLIVEGVIEFKSGNKKNTEFVFKETHRGLVGINEDFASSPAFKLMARAENKKLITEGLKYRYSIGENVVRGNTAKK